MEERNVSIDWITARESNLANWNDRVPLHEEAYEISEMNDPHYISSVVTQDLEALAPFLPGGSVEGLELCHLQCHIGTDTLSLARAGAVVTGVDFSAPALASARKLGERLDLPATWVESDVLAARAAVIGDFDIVYTSIGTITWLNDLDKWAQQIVGLLRPGGIFFIRDGHPVLYSLDETSRELRIGYRYFGNGKAQQWDDQTTYAGDGLVKHGRTFEWPHPISETLNALIGAGLRILRMEEGKILPWKLSPRMISVEGGYAWPDAERDHVPCTFTLIAIRD